MPLRLCQFVRSTTGQWAADWQHASFAVNLVQDLDFKNDGFDGMFSRINDTQCAYCKVFFFWGKVAEVIADALVTAVDECELRLPTLEEHLVANFSSTQYSFSLSSLLGVCILLYPFEGESCREAADHQRAASTDGAKLSLWVIRKQVGHPGVNDFNWAKPFKTILFEISDLIEKPTEHLLDQLLILLRQKCTRKSM